MSEGLGRAAGELTGRDRLIEILNERDNTYCCHDRCMGHTMPPATPEIEAEADVLAYELVREWQERDACT